MATEETTSMEREQIEQVFGLTGGELSDEPWIVTVDGQEWTFHYWYEFPPEYAERQTIDGVYVDSTGDDYRTIVRSCMFGDPPQRIGEWELVAKFASSGETECPARNDPETTVATADCPLCEARAGEDHGCIYIGDGWAELVYRQTTNDPTTTEETTTMQPVTEWARENGRAFSWSAALDNYEPTRAFAYGVLYTYSTETVTDGIVIEDTSELKNGGRDALFLIDDGRTIRPYYTAAWHPEGTHLIIHPFPTNHNAADGRPVDFRYWMLGPRRAYHLKVTAPPSDNL